MATLTGFELQRDEKRAPLPMVTPSATTFSGNTGSTPCASKTFHPQRCVALSLPPNRARFNWIGFATYGKKVLASVAFAGFEPPINYRVNPSPTAIVTGDFNRDGNVDLVVTGCGDRNCSTTGSVISNGQDLIPIGFANDDSCPRSVDHLDFRHRMNLPCSVSRQILSPVVLISGSALH